MDVIEYNFLPEVNCVVMEECEKSSCTAVIGDSPCPCCGYITIPNKGDALAFICPVCMWEIDCFIKDNDEKSEQNGGLTLNQARENYRKFGVVQESLRKYCRKPNQQEKLLNKPDESKVDK